MTLYNLVEIHRRSGKVSFSVFTKKPSTDAPISKQENVQKRKRTDFFFFLENIGKAREGASVVYNIFAASAIMLDK